MKRAPDFLEEGAATFRERNKIYGNNYLNYGSIFSAMFPDGLTLKSERDWDLFISWVQCQLKSIRFSTHFANEHEAHEDSVHDLMVYASMLQEIAAQKEDE